MHIYKARECMTGSLPFAVSKGVLKSGCKEDTHMHEFIELVYITSGKTTHYIDSVAYDAGAGDIVFVNYGQTHLFVSVEDAQYYNLFVKPEYISEKLADAQSIYDVFSFFIMGNYFDDSWSGTPLTHFSYAQKSQVDRLAHSMYEEFKSREEGYELALDGYMRLIFSNIIRCLKTSKPNKLYAAITLEILDFIDKNYTKAITPSELAGKCFYNSAYLGRLFKTTFNISIRDYITEKRIEYAKKLLNESGDTIENISSLAGFSDKKQFYRVFKEKTGCTPGQYRDGK